MKKNMKIWILAGSCILLIGIIVTVFLLQKFAPSKEHMNLAEYFKMQKSDVKLIIENEILDADALYQDRQVYVNMDTVKDRLNASFFRSTRISLLISG